ncbi:MAG: hypothetical protein QOC71_882 [Thermoplasmata archaeon]|nr:hypothetical protein [Thermoplasmata archaeon]
MTGRAVALLTMLSFSLAVLAGCSGKPSQDAPATPGDTAAGWALDCSLGSFELAHDPAWAQPCEVRASHTDGSKTEMWIAVNPTDARNVIIGAKDLNPESSGNCVWNGLSVTHDGGETWRDVTIGGKYSERSPTDPTFGYACNTDPMFQFTADGAVHYGVEMYDLLGIDKNSPPPANAGFAPGWKVLLATSHDGGDTWPDLVTYHPDLLTVSDYSRMTINPATQSIVESIGSGLVTCHVMVSTDGGKTALFYNAVSPDGVPCSSNNGAIAGSPDGTLVIVGNDIAARSTDDGKTWVDSNPVFTFKGIQQFKESEYRNGSNLELAYDLSAGAGKGTLYAAYGAADRDEADVYARSSTDDGRTWSEPVLVNDDAEGTHQWMPNVAVAGDGSVHVVFMDKRYDPEHRLIDITDAVSTDGGRTWTNHRISSVSYDGELGVHQDGGPFIGDYLGVAAAGDHVWAGFPDASNGQVPSTAAAHLHRTS